MAKKVFCSHRSIDKPKVEDFARRLRENGIDAWLDKWEVQPGDDIVAKINQGLAEMDAGLIFFSRNSPGGEWLKAEVSSLIYEMIESGKLVIPVLIDPDAQIPPLLKPRARRGNSRLLRKTTPGTNPQGYDHQPV